MMMAMMPTTTMMMMVTVMMMMINMTMIVPLVAYYCRHYDINDDGDFEAIATMKVIVVIMMKALRMRMLLQ